MKTRLQQMIVLCALVGGVTAAAGSQSIAVSGDPAMLSIGTATAGQDPDPVTESSTTYQVTTTAAGQRIVARLESPLPTGVTLEIEVVAPSGASSSGRVPLATLDREIVGPVPVPGSFQELRIFYRLAATIKSGPVSMSTVRVILTVVDGEDI